MGLAQLSEGPTASLMTDTADAVERGREAWARVQNQARLAFDDWVLIAKALSIGRAACLRKAGARRPFGSVYNKKMGKWLRANGLASISAQQRYRALELLDNLAAVEAWRNKLGEAKRLKFNHPAPTVRAWKRSLHRLDPTPERVTASTLVWPSELLTAARRGIGEALERYGPDTLMLARACLNSALPDADTVQRLLDFQPKPCATPSAQSRPISPAMAVMQSHNH